MLKIRGTLVEVGGRRRIKGGSGIVGRREEHIGSRGRRSSLGGGYLLRYISFKTFN